MVVCITFLRSHLHADHCRFRAGEAQEPMSIFFQKTMKLPRVYGVLPMGRRGVSLTTSAGNWKNGRDAMKALILFIGWCLLFVLCWPVALLTLVLFPFVWLISLPLRLIGITL